MIALLASSPKNTVTLTRQRVVEVADPYKIRGNKIVRISRADDIRPYKIVLICNIDCLPIADIYNYKLLLCFTRSFLTVLSLCGAFTKYF